MTLFFDFKNHNREIRSPGYAQLFRPSVHRPRRDTNRCVLCLLTAATLGALSYRVLEEAMNPTPIFNEAQTIGANVRRLREAVPYSQQELALRLRPWGIFWAQPTVSRVESGMRELTFSEAWAVVTICGGSFEDLCWIPDTVNA